MITINTKGGLGNQMFQYACGRALSLRNSDNLEIVRVENSSDIMRSFSLKEFSIVAKIVSPRQISLKQRFQKLFEQKILRRFFVNFVPSIISSKGNVYLDGYFQSEKYFLDCADTIRKDFKLKRAFSDEIKKTAEQITNDPNAVSLHVRRGDYVNHPDFGGITNRDYYEKAIEEILKHVSLAHFYIFSDDIEWCRANLPISNQSVFVSQSDMKDSDELVMMSLCKHNIIANSSFSWWGAWLNENSEKVVIAPTKWSNLHPDWYKDIIPKTWIRV